MKVDFQNLWFTADLHLGHKKVIEYDKRPFSSIEEHDESLLSNWNSRVQPVDHVFVLGDFSFAPPSKYLGRLKGTKYLIRGNHDVKTGGFSQVFDYLDLKVLNENYENPYTKYQHLCLFHYPIAEWNKAHRGSIHLYGHTHGNSWFDGVFAPVYKCINVGSPVCDYAPISYEEVLKRVSQKGIVSHNG